MQTLLVRGSWSWVVLVALFLGCDGKEPKDTDSPATDTDADTDADSDSDSDSDADSDPVVSIVSPSEGATVSGSSVTLEYSVTNFTLDANAGGANAPDAGHVHIYDNGVYIDYSADTSFTMSGLAGGAHAFTVRLANNDYSELTSMTGAFYEASVNVNLVSPSIQILDPTNNKTLRQSSVAATIQISDFTMDPLGSANADGHGHYNLYVDGEFLDADTDPNTALFRALVPGNHTLKAELAANDGTPLNTSGTCGVDNLTCAEVAVEVSSDAPYIRILPVDTGWGSGTVPVSLIVDNFALSDEIGGANASDGGHVRVYVDGVFQGATAETNSYVFNVAAGDHVVEARIAENDGTENGPVDRIRINLASDRRDIMILEPLADASVTSPVSLALGVENFTLDAASIGGANVSGVGHYAIYVDGIYYNYSASGSDSVSGLSSGSHTIGVELVENDHSVLSPVVRDEVTVVVP